MAVTKFEEIIVNPGIFRIILDEFLHNQPSSFDIMTVESPEDRLFKDHARMPGFCQRIRSREDGLHRCMNCDIEFAERAKNAGKPLHYMCHAGLMEIAVPIVVGNELVATIFFGRIKSKDKILEKEAVKNASVLETELGFRKSELLKLREEAPALPDEQVEEIKNKLWEVATYVSSLGSSKLEAEHARRDLSYRLKETESIQGLLLELSDIVDNMEKFWRRLDVILQKICVLIGANAGLFVTYEFSISDKENRGCIQSVANLPNSLLGKFLPYDSRIAESISEMMPITVLFSEALFAELKEYLLTEDMPSTTAIVPIRLEPKKYGVMILFVTSSKEVSGGLEIKQELSLLGQAGTHIATAYGNCLLYQKQKELAEIQSDWLEDVSHQILAPLNGILGQTENLARHFRTWQTTNPQRIDNTLVTLIELSDWATRVTKNFAWLAQGPVQRREMSMRLEEDIAGKLIGYARNVQGLARTSGIRKVHVDSNSIKQLNGKIIIDNQLLKLAITNLLDNAIKYADPGTDVVINASMSLQFGLIAITNYGIPILESEVEKVFHRYYRTESAKKKYSVGSGIGLGITREIARLHGGDLTVSPSVHTYLGWKTTFVISLPLVKEPKDE